MGAGGSSPLDSAGGNGIELLLSCEKIPVFDVFWHGDGGNGSSWCGSGGKGSIFGELNAVSILFIGELGGKGGNGKPNVIFGNLQGGKGILGWNCGISSCV